MPFAATEPLLVTAFTPPAPVRLAEDIGFGAVAEAAGAVLGVALGLGACACVAVLIVLLAALLAALEVALEVAAFGTAADPCFTAFVAGCSFGLSIDPPIAP